ncbi:MAG TPA: DUF4276 family protein [Pyrinomonadaceae bacterium]|jgi:hypothetical protein
MKEVMVYVEGPSDKAAMQALLRPLLEQKQQEGTTINFFESPVGDKKESVLMKVPIRAANIILNDPYSIVVAMPDLYPKNKAFPHETVDQLVHGILQNFSDALRMKKAQDDTRLKERFKVFCFKYELEALVLAAEDSLKNRLGANSLNVTWQIPVEDQNHDLPPKRIIESLFEKYGKRYTETVDAPLILSKCLYQDIADRCFQCFKPFVEFLVSL